MLANIPLCSIIIIVLILIFAIIHLGVNIGIIAGNRQYKDIFRPEIGLASFNIVISFLGFVVSILGLVCLLTNHRILSKFLCFLTIDILKFTSILLLRIVLVNRCMIDKNICALF